MELKFIDLFAGCGGLSLGLSEANMQGLFAVEHNESAFETLQHNLLGAQSPRKFDWPDWLPIESTSIENVLESYLDELKNLQGSVDLVVGGPPCQGFSSAGRRRADDPRNKLFEAYVKFVDLVQPKALLLENVRGFTADFKSQGKTDNYASKLREKLADRYTLHERLLDLSMLGVPQTRTRYFLVAFEKGLTGADPFDLLEKHLPSFLRKRRISVPVSSSAAICDLEIAYAGITESRETKGFQEIAYRGPRTQYQRAMAKKQKGTTDLRLARHGERIVERFASFIEFSHNEGRLNKSMSAEVRQKFGIKKLAFRVIDPDQPAPTITSMPDDLVHYSEPRTLTVRENARLQSFPDWFEFKGKYTTGGERRRFEVPRFTQVANAVPPLAATALGEVIVSILKGADEAKSYRRQTNSGVQNSVQFAETVT